MEFPAEMEMSVQLELREKLEVLETMAIMDPQVRNAARVKVFKLQSYSCIETVGISIS